MTWNNLFKGQKSFLQKNKENKNKKAWNSDNDEKHNIKLDC